MKKITLSSFAQGKRNFSSFVSTILLLTIVLVSNLSYGQINMTTTGSHVQNFNTIASSGTTTTWVNISTIVNWYF